MRALLSLNSVQHLFSQTPHTTTPPFLRGAPKNAGQLLTTQARSRPGLPRNCYAENPSLNVQLSPRPSLPNHPNLISPLSHLRTHDLLQSLGNMSNLQPPHPLSPESIPTLIPPLHAPLRPPTRRPTSTPSPSNQAPTSKMEHRYAPSSYHQNCDTASYPRHRKIHV